MTLSTIVVAVSLSGFAAQAVADHWVTVSPMSFPGSIKLDQDSIRRGENGLIYFSSDSSSEGKWNEAVDCKKRMIYPLKVGLDEVPDWRDRGDQVKPDSTDAMKLRYVCANAP